MLKQLVKKVQMNALSSTIGNPDEREECLKEKLIIDDWRPIKLHKGVYLDWEIEF